jgi:hypothetical protein
MDNFMANITNFYVLDSNGKKIPNKATRTAVISARDSIPKTVTTSKETEEYPSFFALFLLEDAIFEHGYPYRNEYLFYRMSHPEMNALQVLKHFWGEDWRTVNGKQVIKKHPNNPYMK